MGALKLTYYDRQRDLEVNPNFSLRVLEKNAPREKNRVSSSTYGFNGMEKDNDVAGGIEGAVYNLGLRCYDSRVGRMFSVDPRAPEYPWQSPFVYHRNNPINYIDFLGGGDPEKPKGKGKEGQTETTVGDGDPADDFSTTLQQWVYHGGDAAGDGAGWVTEETYANIIYSLGKVAGYSKASAKDYRYGVKPIDYDNSFLTQALSRDWDNLSHWQNVFSKGASAGESEYYFKRSGTIHTTSLEFDVLSLGYTLVPKIVPNIVLFGVKNISVKTGTGKLVLWTGSRSFHPETAAMAAEAFALETGRKTLSMTPAGKFVGFVNRYGNSLLTKTQWNDVWRISSTRVARASSGDIHLIMGKKVSQRSYFWKYEFPEILEQNLITKPH